MTIHETSRTRVSGTVVLEVSGMYPTLHYVDVLNTDSMTKVNYNGRSVNHKRVDYNSTKWSLPWKRRNGARSDNNRENTFFWNELTKKQLLSNQQVYFVL